MTQIFSKIRADVATEFVKRFPEHYDFVGMLRRVGDDLGVRVIKRPDYYRLEGQWLPMGQIHDTLTRTLAIYGTSVTIHNYERSTSDQFDVNITKNLDTPTPQIDSSVVGIKPQIATDMKMTQGVNINVNSLDPDDDCDEENHEYNSLKNTISDICSSLGKEDELSNVDHHNDDVSKTGHSFGKEGYRQLPVMRKNVSSKGSEFDGLNILSSSRKSATKKKNSKHSSPTYSRQKELLEGQDKKTVLTEKCYTLVNKDTGDPKIYQCVDCDFTHKSITAVREHFSRMHRAKPTKCDVCHKLFPSERYAKRHCRLVHRDTQYCCDVCGKTYKILRTLEDHLKSHNDGYVKPDFPCDICKKTFSSHYVLKCHIKSIHYGENRTYLCPVCGKSFTTKHSLNMHQNIHSGNRPFTCNICGKGFMYDSALRDHKFIHSGKKKFECEICCKAFQQRSGLQMHAKIHKEKKAYECKDCGRAFIQKQSLQRHERSHKGEKPFFCKVCGRFFGDSGIIRRHLIMVHKINKDTKSWREDIVEKGRENTEEAKGEDAISLDAKKYSDLSKTKTQEPQKQKIMENIDDETNQSSVSHLKFQEDSVAGTVTQPSDDTGTLKALGTSPTLESLPTSPTSSSPNLLQGAAEPTYLPDAQAFITNEYCRPMPLPTQLPPLVTSQGVDVTSYSLHPHQHSSYLNPPPSSHMEPSRYHYPMPCSQQAVGIVADARCTLTQTEPNNLSLPRVDSVLNKCLHDMEPPENLSISSLYAYYTSLASQYLNASQYQGYGESDSIRPDQE
ncbi:zinc finger protein 808-like [Pecten maximus]|uniref:zinc finger protein 808-like n=1 Tax=Pecten maximus TaxID=6579 RepID=UPI001458BC5A|nr:zinc finger protein 808-like [Pecten maximus]